MGGVKDKQWTVSLLASKLLVCPTVRSLILVTLSSLKQNTEEIASCSKTEIQVRPVSLRSTKVTLGFYFLICEKKR